MKHEFRILLLSLTACASAPEAPRAYGELQQDMQQIASQILELQTLVVAPPPGPMKPETRAKAVEHLKTLESALSHARTLKHLEGAPYQVSADGLLSHVKEARQAYETGATDYGRWMVQAIPTACASCHAQQPHSPRPLWEMRAEDLEGTELQRAELLFATRNYDAAMQAYDRILDRASVERNPDLQQLELAFRRTLTIDLRVRRDLAAAQGRVGRFLKQSPLAMRNAELLDWRVSLRRLAKLSLPKDSGRLPEFVQSQVSKDGDMDMPEALYLSGLLLEALPELKDPDAQARAFYLIGNAEEALSRDYFFGYSRAYWRACLDRFSATRSARSCYEALEASLRDLYSGSGGFRAPPEVEKELRAYRNRLGINP